MLWRGNDCNQILPILELCLTNDVITQSKTYDSVTDKFLDFSFEKTNSAYMLFYEWSNSSYEPEPSSSMLSKDLEDWIWKDNRNFLRDKNIFEHTYFK